MAVSLTQNNTPHARCENRKGESGIELLVDCIGHCQQFVAVEVRGGQSVADVTVYPVEDADIAFERVAESRLAVTRSFGAHVERQAPPALVLVHELRHRRRPPAWLCVARQEPATDQVEAA